LIEVKDDEIVLVMSKLPGVLLLTYEVGFLLAFW
jgi:hypothetical protein